LQAGFLVQPGRALEPGQAVTQRGRHLHKIAATVARSSPEKSGHVHYEYFVVAASAGGWSESFTRLS
ncbi:hypothetical protein ACLBUT_34115, partial [Pseudomonas aeruginosa]|uniref:hypothetical protein n=1 Tax=Pseudomonas aeruginosa TaxID=287 RepID=UPI003967E363